MIEKLPSFPDVSSFFLKPDIDISAASLRKEKSICDILQPVAACERRSRLVELEIKCFDSFLLASEGEKDNL